MIGAVQFMRGLAMAALLMGAAGTLVEATGIVGREAAKAQQRGGIKFKWLNQQLVVLRFDGWRWQMSDERDFEKLRHLEYKLKCIGYFFENQGPIDGSPLDFE